MNLNEAIEKLSGLVSKFNADTTETKETFVDAKLIDGTIIRYESLEVGMPLMVIDEAGNELPAPDGEHELEDGTKVKVEGGIIIEIESKEEEMPEEEMPIEQPMAAVETVSKEDFETLKSEVADLKTKFEEFSKTNETLASENVAMKEIVKETFSIVEKLAAIPTENPVSVRSNNPFKKTITREQEIENLINKFKNK